MSNYDAVLQKRLELAVALAFFFSTLLFPLMLFLVLKKSRQMKKYKFYLVNNVCWCYSYHTCVFLARPSFMFPSFCLVIDPLIPIPKVLVPFGIFLVLFIVINLDLSVVESLFYRYSQAFPGWLSVYFDQSRSVYAVYGAVHLFCYATVIGPMVYGHIWDGREARAQFVNENPDMEAIADSLTFVCFVNGDLSRWAILYVAVLLMSFFTLGTTLYTVLFFRMRKTKRESTISSTYRLQLMLFRAISAQLYIGYCLLLLPVALTCVLVFLQVPHAGVYSSIVVTMMAFHGPVDYLCILWFITPYRKCVMEWMGFDIRSVVGGRRTTFGTTTVTTFTTIT